MPKIEILGQGQYEVAPGANLLRFLQERGYDTKLPASCNGEGSCSTCACRVLSGAGQPSANEVDILSKEQLQQHWRLSCQVKVQQDVQVIVPGYEPPEALDIEPEALQKILQYAAVNFALREIQSQEKVT